MKSANKIQTIGIIGGGQLGRMTCLAAHKMGFECVIFTNEKDSPASFVTKNVIIANYDDKAALEKFASLIDIATFEFENIPVEPVEFLATKVTVFPKPEILKTTQNRILEKGFINSIGIKTANYAEIKSLEELETNLKKFEKAILKTATMGYDGKGQFVLKNLEDARNAWQEAKNHKLILEQFCPFDSEISVMVARSKSGEIKAYEPLTNIHKNGILDESHYPAKISNALKEKAQKIAEKIAKEIDLIGIMAVEMFVIGEELLINELAPRPHNSGHFSMDACNTSQFEQLIRAIVDLELGSCEFHSSGYMKNLIGDEINDVQKYQKISNAKIHLYDKREVRSGRKMAHVNILN